MRRRAMVLWHGTPAGFLVEVEDDFMFQYAEESLSRADKQAVGFTWIKLFSRGPKDEFHSH